MGDVTHWQLPVRILVRKYVLQSLKHINLIFFLSKRKIAVEFLKTRVDYVQIRNKNSLMLNADYSLKL